MDLLKYLKRLPSQISTNSKHYECDRFNLMFIDINEISRDARNLPNILSVEEKQRVSKYKTEKQKFQYLISRTILRLILAQHLEVNPKNVIFSYSKRGKPGVLLDENKKIFFSLAHSRNITIFAFSEKYDLGVDIEYICKTKNNDLVIKQFFSKNEQRLLFSLQEEKRVDLFFEMWVTKEAYLKGTGLGIMDLDKIEVVYGESSVIVNDNITGKNISDWSFFIISPIKHFTACVALKCNE